MTEAERVMPEYTARIRAQLQRQGLGAEDIMIRMTGCPNGCARPYMAELAFVGDGKDTYQLWVAGSPNLDGRTGIPLLDKVADKKMEETLAPLFAYWKEARHDGEKFGDFTHRIGKDGLLAYMDGYTVTEKDLAESEADLDSDSDVSISPVVTQAELRAAMAETKGDETDIACEIDKLDYLQVIPECRDEEAAAQISDVSDFRMFKGNLAQWRVSWAVDNTTSWETFEKLDSEPLRAKALELKALVK